jgi:NAD(P)H-dependent FMN reductase
MEAHAVVQEEHRLMKVLGIVGSPRRERGLSHQVVDRVLAGARAAGAQTKTLYLIDDEPQYCIHCGHDCFGESDCAQEPGATDRSKRIDAADALVICAPVYCWQPSGLTVAMFDKVRMATGSWTRGTQHGRLALGIAIAGGTGTGVFPALQSIYAWLCSWKFRPLDPLPVTKFNLVSVLERADAYGQTLAKRPPEPFEDLADQMLTYDAVPFMDYGRIDEFRWLAEQTAAGLQAAGRNEGQVEEIKRLLDEAADCGDSGDQTGQAQRVLQAYQTGAGAW